MVSLEYAQRWAAFARTRYQRENGPRGEKQPGPIVLDRRRSALRRQRFVNYPPSYEAGRLVVVFLNCASDFGKHNFGVQDINSQVLQFLFVFEVPFTSLTFAVPECI